jgi:hypothetical protein
MTGGHLGDTSIGRSTARPEHHSQWWALLSLSVPPGSGMTQGLGRPMVLYRLISNGLCDHTRAMPRPVANIVCACVCIRPRTELATLRS